MKRRINRIRELLHREEGHAVAYGGGGLLTIVLVVILIVLIF